MSALKGFLFAALMALSLLPVQQARAELIASTGDPNFVYLAPFRNDLSSITLIWPIDQNTLERVSELTAGLDSVVNGGTKLLSPADIKSLVRTKGIQRGISVVGRNLLLSVSATESVFPEALDYLETVLLEANYSKGWYLRELELRTIRKASKSGEPAHALAEVADFLLYQPTAETHVASDGKFRFGRPSQVILRSENEEDQFRAVQLIRNLPGSGWRLPIGKWAAALAGLDDHLFALPTGTIHFPDPDSSEMLVLLVNARRFKDEADQIGANLLVDYIGANSGSEMFRIIRQEMRAAYDPSSSFTAPDKNKAIISLSATVKAEQWPEIHAKIRDIYENTRSGNVDPEGLALQRQHMLSLSSNHFFHTPLWGERQYLYEYPNGSKGPIELPLFHALEAASIDKIVANAEAHLPPFDDFLLILIGGGPLPTEVQRANGYCALPKSAPLSFCLKELSEDLE